MAVEPFLGTRAQKAFVGTIILNAIVVLTMVAIAFGQVETNVDTGSRSSFKTIPCYLALFALAELFELLMALDALKLRNIVQLAGILLFHVALIVMSSLQVHEAKTALVFLTDDPCTTFVGCDGPHTLWRNVEPLLIVVPVILGVSFVVMAFFVKELFSEFGWAVFQVVGANPVMKSMYQWYQIEICLLKFDFFFFGGVTMQMLILVLPSDSAEFGLTITAIPVVFVLLILAGLAVKREIKWLMTISLILMLAAETYFIYKLVRFFSPSSRAEYETVRASLTTFTVVAFIILFLTFAVGLRCFSDFDRGLESAKMTDLPEKAPYSLPNTPGAGSERMNSYTGGAPLQPRLSIE